MGQMKDWDFTPDWGPLEAIAGDHPEMLDEFMFMGRLPKVGTVQGIRMYKHRDTRKYLNLDENGLYYGYQGAFDDYACYGPVTLGVIAAVRGVGGAA